jgi:hypothetical protein
VLAVVGDQLRILPVPDLMVVDWKGQSGNVWTAAKLWGPLPPVRAVANIE